MTPLKIVQTTPGQYSLLLEAGTTAVDPVVEELGHEPNGYFWEGVAQLVVLEQAPELDGRFSYDPEGDMFSAHGNDQSALRELGALMGVVANDATKMRDLVAAAQKRGFEFDD